MLSQPRCRRWLQAALLAALLLAVLPGRLAAAAAQHRRLRDGSDRVAAATRAAEAAKEAEAAGSTNGSLCSKAVAEARAAAFEEEPPAWAVRGKLRPKVRVASLASNRRAVAGINAAGRRLDLVLYGDSITSKIRMKCMEEWRAAVGDAWGAVPLGVGGSTICELTWRLMSGGERLEADPRLLLLLIGINDMPRDEPSPAEKMAFLLDWLARAHLTSRVVLLRPLPTVLEERAAALQAAFEEVVAEHNAALAGGDPQDSGGGGGEDGGDEGSGGGAGGGSNDAARTAPLAGAAAGVLLASCGSELDPRDPELFIDGLHPTCEAYATILACIGELTAGLLGDDTSDSSADGCGGRGGAGTGNGVQAVSLSCAPPPALGAWNATKGSKGFSAEPPRVQQKRYLVLAAVGDSWSAQGNRWLDVPADAAFDVVTVYYGNNTAWSCPACLHTFRMPGVKSQVIHAALATPEWKSLAAAAGQRWRYVWLADSDVEVSACTLTRFFRNAEANQLLLAQMSASFFSVVHPSMANSWTGYGLDTLWPWLLRFPRNTVAVVDAFCMAHRGRAGRAAAEAGTSGKAAGTSNYAAADVTSTHEPGMEQGVVLGEWNFTAASLAADQRVLGPVQLPLPIMRSFVAATATANSRVLLVKSMRGWRRGIRTVVFTNSSGAALAAEQAEGACWGEHWRHYPDFPGFNVIRKHGDPLTAAAPVLAAAQLAATGGTLQVAAVRGDEARSGGPDKCNGSDCLVLQCLWQQGFGYTDPGFELRHLGMLLFDTYRAKWSEMQADLTSARCWEDAGVGTAS
ncbi:Adenosylmethionine-8-amino-7-oxononanoate aminotransferase isoform B [Micractinium conductrix]|uniref:Adenosylmethionine-8-amino-7-oxononanoate aminotransferase isoform B n=1 Tax=Micractinium conductrix TaxID=554055 RepID=A0A2P6VGF0_9CHLO|nr:Adenosylmethionine-8-amino-7-oxononanoate aminotransferase isoform B [Micractinium conductrix]|eukprot:PSC73166.1 Adenosylmethionine-8-amino-7-oxononanoate aminotransferase isoform B [Micractinium conductrix]